MLRKINGISQVKGTHHSAGSQQVLVPVPSGWVSCNDLGAPGDLGLLTWARVGWQKCSERQWPSVESPLSVPSGLQSPKFSSRDPYPQREQWKEACGHRHLNLLKKVIQSISYRQKSSLDVNVQAKTENTVMTCLEKEKKYVQNLTGTWVLFTWASSLRCFASRRNLTASKLKPSTPFVSQYCIIS